jgi:quinol monooxygenase YgiN
MEALPEKQKELSQTILSLVKIIKKEKGCISCTVLQDIENENSFCLIEMWKSQKDFDNHLTSVKFNELLEAQSFLHESLNIKIGSVLATEYVKGIINAIHKKLNDQ